MTDEKYDVFDPPLGRRGVVEKSTRVQFVFVIGLHTVQFGNNWMRKIPRTAKLDEAVLSDGTKIAKRSIYYV